MVPKGWINDDDDPSGGHYQVKAIICPVLCFISSFTDRREVESLGHMHIWTGRLKTGQWHKVLQGGVWLLVRVLCIENNKGGCFDQLILYLYNSLFLEKTLIMPPEDCQE